MKKKLPFIPIIILLLFIGSCKIGGTPDPVTTTTESTTTTVETTTTTIAPTTTVPQPSSDLDHSGDTIPDTDYPIPAGAAFMATDGSDNNKGSIGAPVASLRRAVQLAGNGGTIVVRGGEYRSWHENGSGGYGIVGQDLTIQAYPHEQPWFNGSDIVTNWVKDGNNWSVFWNTPSFCHKQYYATNPQVQGAGPCSYPDNPSDPNYPMAADPQMVFIDNIQQRQVETLNKVTTGTFYYDRTTKKIIIGTDPANKTVELAARPSAITLGNNKIYAIKGIGFRKYASNVYPNATGAAVTVGSDHLEIENSVFASNAGVGIRINSPRNGTYLRRVVVANNGGLGMSSNGSSNNGDSPRNDLLVEDSVFNSNNQEHFDAKCRASCEAANLKMAHMIGFIIRNNVFENAVGNAVGVWCDINCSDGVIVNNLVRNNGNNGIFYEISSKGIIASNLVVNNGRVGIQVAAATTKVYNNTVVTDKANQPLAQGIFVYDDDRYPGNPKDTGPNTTQVQVANNIVVGSDNMLFLSMDGPGANNTKTSQFFDVLGSNVYVHDQNKNFVNWAAGSSSPKYFKSLAEYQNYSGWEQSSVERLSGSPVFVNPDAGDYSTIEAFTGLPLPSDVAKELGLSDAVSVRRGALAWPR